MGYMERYKFWMETDYFDGDTKKELEKIKNNPGEIEERFYKDLEFGTGGLRGIIGAGTNRINIYTVRKVSQGLALHLLDTADDAGRRGIVIAYDSRHMSAEFAMEAARVFASNGIIAWLFGEMRPTPELSFAVRYLKAAAGIVITASHNPSQYNGYKVYGEDGGQLPLEESGSVLEKIKSITELTTIVPMEANKAFEQKLIRIIGEEIDDAYIKSIKTLMLNPLIMVGNPDLIKIVFTPLHGTGNKPVRRVLNETGFGGVYTVARQELPDPDFSTVKQPNPEEKDAFKLAIELAHKKDADLIIGTDPDADRVGMAIKNPKGEYILLSGNQIGCLILDYILSEKAATGSLPENGFVMKTIVTSELARKIADYHGVELFEVLTGFKFIGEKIKELDEQGQKKFIFGFEESYGFLAGTFSRDKDAVVTCMLIAEMTAHYKKQGLSLYQGLMNLYKKYGYYIELNKSFTLEGKAGQEKISGVMETFRERKSDIFGAGKIRAIRDYKSRTRFDIASGKTEALGLPISDVLYYELVDGSWFCIRPSGTEPKIKAYCGVSGATATAAEKKLQTIKEDMFDVLEAMLR